MQQQQQPTPPQPPPPSYTEPPFKPRASAEHSKCQPPLNSDESLLLGSKRRLREEQILRKPEKTKPIIWFAAILCMIFTLLIIFFGIAVLIIFLAVQPKTPAFDTPGASVAATYVNPPQFFGNDMTFLANFSNPNKKLEVKYEHLYFELSFAERLIAAQAIQPFSQRPGESKLVSVHLLSSLGYAPPNMAVEFQKQRQMNRVVYHLKGTFRVRIKLGSIHYSYWLHGDCQLDMASPPNGILLAHSCKTKR